MKSIIVKTQFEGIHCWPEAPAEVSFLRSPHRHMFHVEAEIEIFHEDRELEFIMVKRDLEDALRLHIPVTGGIEQTCVEENTPAQTLWDEIWDNTFGENFDPQRISCEQWASMIQGYLKHRYKTHPYPSTDPYGLRTIRVKVLEDGENGALVG